MCLQREIILIGLTLNGRWLIHHSLTGSLNWRSRNIIFGTDEIYVLFFMEKCWCGDQLAVWVYMGNPVNTSSVALRRWRWVKCNRTICLISSRKADNTRDYRITTLGRDVNRPSHGQNNDGFQKIIHFDGLESKKNFRLNNLKNGVPFYTHFLPNICVMTGKVKK